MVPLEVRFVHDPDSSHGYVGVALSSNVYHGYKSGSDWQLNFGEVGGCMLQIDCNVDEGGMEINPEFFVDLGNEPNGPTRVHEMRYPGGDCTSDIWI